MARRCTEVKTNWNLEDFTYINLPAKHFHKHSVSMCSSMFMPKGSRSPTVIMDMSGSSRSFAAMLCTSTTLISQPFWPSRAWQKWAKTNVMFHQMLLRSHARSCATRQRESPGLVNFADKKTASRYVITLAGDTQRPQGAIRAV